MQMQIHTPPQACLLKGWSSPLMPKSDFQRYSSKIMDIVEAKLPFSITYPFRLSEVVVDASVDLVFFSYNNQVPHQLENNIVFNVNGYTITLDKNITWYKEYDFEHPQNVLSANKFEVCDTYYRDETIKTNYHQLFISFADIGPKTKVIPCFVPVDAAEDYKNVTKQCFGYTKKLNKPRCNNYRYPLPNQQLIWCHHHNNSCGNKQEADFLNLQTKKGHSGYIPQWWIDEVSKI
jgi:hypothetical protein